MRFLASCAGLTILVGLVGPWPISAADPLEAPLGGEARRLVAAAGRAAAEEARASAAAGERLHAGFGRREIAVPLGPGGAALAGYGPRAGLSPARAEAVADPCFARAIALRSGERGAPALVLGADLLYVNEVVRARAAAAIEAESGVPGERILFTATHTHSGPGNFAIGLAEALAAGGRRDEVVEAIARALSGAARDALAGLAPAEVLAVRVAEPRFVKNRYWRPEERIVPVDADLTAFWFRAPGGPGGRPLRGILAVYGAHATVVGPERPLVSGDYPGAFAARIEGRPGAPVALFAAGPVGSQAPRPPPGESADDLARARALGDALAARAEEALARPEAERAFAAAPGLGFRTAAAVPLPPLLFRLAPGWRASPALLAAVHPAPDRGPVSILRLGRDLVLGLPAEISGEVSLDMKHAARARGLRLTVTSFSGGYHGYVPPDEVYGRWRYENRLSLHGPRFAAFLGALAAEAGGAE